VLTDPTRRRLVLVSGPPGSGKTTVAVPLAAELGFALLAKDRIKETLYDWLGQEAPPLGQEAQDAGREARGTGHEPRAAGREAPDLGWSRRLGAASMELLWALAADAPAAVLDANFWPDDPRCRSHITALAARPVEVFCHCPAEECMRRYADRLASRHAVHLDGHHLQFPGQQFTRSERPIGLGAVLTVDTTGPVNIPALARAVREQLP
jgi:predicted kinase